MVRICCLQLAHCPNPICTSFADVKLCLDGVASIQRTLDNLKAGQGAQQSAKSAGGSNKSSTASAVKGDGAKGSGSVGGAKKK